MLAQCLPASYQGVCLQQELQTAVGRLVTLALCYLKLLTDALSFTNEMRACTKGSQVSTDSRQSNKVSCLWRGLDTALGRPVQLTLAARYLDAPRAATLGLAALRSHFWRPIAYRARHQGWNP